MSRHVAMRHVVSGCVLASLLFLVSSRSTDTELENYARVKVAQAELQASSAELTNLEQTTSSQLTEFAANVAELRQQIDQLDYAQATLAEKIGVEGIFALGPSAQTEKSTSGVNLQNDDQYQNAPLVEQIKMVQQDIALRQNQLGLLEKLVMGHHIQTNTEISGRPITRGWLSSYYGMRDDPFTGKPAMHKGLDFAGKTGADVVTTAAGIVTWAGNRYGYGQLVEVNHGNGFVTRYGHNHEIVVAVGDVVTKGQLIAKMGSTGRSTGPHVHYEVLKNGQQVDPLAYLQ